MNQLKKDLLSLSKTLNQLTRKTEQMAKSMDQVKKVQVAKTTKTGAKADQKKGAKKPVKATAIDTLFRIIEKNKDGVDAATLRKQTGFDNKKVWNHINILKMKGKIKSVKRGVYVKI